MPELTTNVAQYAGVTEAPVKQALARHRLEREGVSTVSTSVEVPYTPPVFRDVGGDGGGRVGLEQTVPFLIFSGPNSCSREAFFNGGGKEGRSPFLRYGRDTSGPAWNNDTEKLSLEGMLCKWTKHNPSETNAQRGVLPRPGQQGLRTVDYLLGRMDKGNIPENRAAIFNDDTFDTSVRMIGVSSEYTQRQFMRANESYTVIPVTNTAQEQSWLIRDVILEGMGRRLARLVKKQMDTWTPYIEPDELVLIGQYARVGDWDTTANKYLEIGAPLGTRQRTKDTLCEWYMQTNGLLSKPVARQASAWYNVLLDLALTINRYFPMDDRLSTPKLVGQLGAMILSMTDKVGEPTSLWGGSYGDTVSDDVTDFARMAANAKEFLAKPWTVNFDNLDPGTCSADLEFQEVLFCFNYVLAQVVKEIGIATVKCELIMPLNRNVGRYLEDLRVACKPDYMYASAGSDGTSLPYALMTPQVGSKERVRGYSAYSLTDRTWYSNKQRSKVVSGLAAKGEWFGVKQVKTIDKTMYNYTQVTLTNGRPDNMPDAQVGMFIGSATITRNASVADGQIWETSYLTVSTQRSRLGSLNWLPNGEDDAMPAATSNPQKLANTQVRESLTWMFNSAEGWFTAYYMDGPSTCTLWNNTSPAIYSPGKFESVQEAMLKAKGYKLKPLPGSIMEYAASQELNLLQDGVVTGLQAPPTFDSLEGGDDVIEDPGPAHEALEFVSDGRIHEKEDKDPWDINLGGE